MQFLGNLVGLHNSSDDDFPGGHAQRVEAPGTVEPYKTAHRSSCLYHSNGPGSNYHGHIQRTAAQ